MTLFLCCLAERCDARAGGAGGRGVQAVGYIAVSLALPRDAKVCRSVMAKRGTGTMAETATHEKLCVTIQSHPPLIPCVRLSAARCAWHVSFV